MRKVGNTFTTMLRKCWPNDIDSIFRHISDRQATLSTAIAYYTEINRLHLQFTAYISAFIFSLERRAK